MTQVSGGENTVVAKDWRGAVIMAIFFVQAVAGGSLTSRIADFQTSLGLSEGALGVALLGAFISGLLCYLVSGRIIEVLGTRLVFLVGLPLIPVTVWLHSVAVGQWTLFLAGFLFGIPWSVFNVAMNVEADRFEAETGQRIMSRCHGWWSAGFLLTALIAVYAREAEISPMVHFAWFIPPVLLTTWLLIWPMQAAQTREYVGQVRKVVAWPTWPVLIFVTFGLAGGFGQLTTQSWSVIYMRDTFDAPTWVDTLSLSIFLLALTIGRLFADGWNVRFGPTRATFVLLVIGLLGVFCVVLAGYYWVALAGFALIGLGICSLYPLMITAAAKVGDRSASDNVASVNLMTGVAMLLAPPLVGYVAEGWGIKLAFGLLVPVFLLSLLLVRRVGRVS